MAWFAGRFWTILLFLLVSAGVWYVLDGFTYRVLFAAIPLLLAVQVTLSDTLEDLLASRFGYGTKWFALLIAPGTVLHELCHLFAALATDCTVTKASLFKPNPQTGVLGYVTYAQPDDKWLVFREFIIGFSPFFGCGVLLFLLNILQGGGLVSLLTSDPISDYAEAVSLLSSVVSSVMDSFSNLDYSKPAIWVIVYLQLCFSVGAAPSGGDFKGTFSSLWKHLLSALLFIAFIVLVVLSSQMYFNLSGFEVQLASIIAVFLKFTALVLLLSITLLSFTIPLAYAVVKVSEIQGIAKTIPATSGFLVYYFVNDRYGVQYAFLAAVAVFTVSLMLLRYGHPLSGKRR